MVLILTAHRCFTSFQAAYNLQFASPAFFAHVDMSGKRDPVFAHVDVPTWLPTCTPSDPLHAK